MSDLVKKLREVGAGGGMVGRDPSKYLGHITVADSWAAADRIEALEAKAERLRGYVASLEKYIVERVPDPDDLRAVLMMVDDLAEEAGLHMSLAGGRAYDRLRATLPTTKGEDDGE